VRIVIADDHPLMRLAIRQVLDAEDDIRVVGEAADAKSLLAETSRTRPDLVVLDLRMPGSRGFSCLRQVKERHPNVKVVIISAEGNQRTIDESRHHGADGFVTKTVETEDLVGTIRIAARGTGFPVATPARDWRDLEAGDLTAREREILALVSRGLSNSAIARELWVTEETVKFHLTNIYRKLGVANRTQAAAWAVEWLHDRAPAA
jgi:two-component system response regulator DegU